MVNITEEGYCKIEVSNNCGTTIDSIFIDTVSMPEISISATDTIICSYETAELIANTQNTITWSTGETTTSIDVSTAGDYYAVASNYCGTDTAYVTINVETVLAEFDATPTSGSPPLIVDFQNNSQNAITYYWTFGDGEFSSIENPTNEYLANGIYETMLIVESKNGCIDTATTTITVESEPHIYVPNAFTPNRDNINDIFKVVVNFDVSEFEAMIFNRWGNHIFTWTKIEAGWDGKTASGVDVQDGVYVYEILVRDETGKLYIKHGTITLMR